MCTMQEIVQYVGKEFGGDMAYELQNCTLVKLIPTPKYPTTALVQHGAREVMICKQQLKA